MRLELIQGDITQVQADAIVNAATARWPVEAAWMVRSTGQAARR